MCADAYDIRTKNTDFQKSLEAETGVKMTDEDENFYLDNCYADYVAICTPTVRKAWIRKKKREEFRNLSAERKRMKIDELRDAESLSYEPDVEDAIDHDQDDHDVRDEHSIPTKVIPTTPTSSRETRSNPVTSSSASHDDKAELKYFPDVKIRTGRRTLNEALVRCIVQCVLEFKVSHADISGIIVRSANMIFGQNWQISSDENVGEDDEANQSDDDSGDENTATSSTTLMRKRKSLGDSTSIFPSKRCISMYLQDAYLLNMKHVASYLTNKGDNVITVGLDDTTKAAGHIMYDIKADHITVHGPEDKKSLITGFTENISHFGEDSAATYEEKLKILAILGESTLDEIKNEIDFWMSDRAGDNETFRESMAIPESKNLKCCAHITLGVDNDCDKVFREAEQRIGVHNLISVKVGEKAFSSSGSSIHTLGEIAISKLLSPSHAAHSVSLYFEFVFVLFYLPYLSSIHEK